MVMEEQRGQELPKTVKNLPPDLKNVVAENSSRTRKVLDSCLHFDKILRQDIFKRLFSSRNTDALQSVLMHFRDE